MTEADLKARLAAGLAGDLNDEVSDKALEALAGHLLWRIGRLSDDGPLTVRVGLPSSAALFGELPKLRSATDEEILAAVAQDDVRVEWVGRVLS